MHSSEAELLQLGADSLNGGVAGELGLGFELLLLSLVVLLRFGLSLGLELRDDSLALPADLGGELTELAGLSVGLDSENLEGLGNDHSLLLVIRIGNTLEDLQSLESSLAAGRLVRKHATERSPEHARGSAVVLEVSSGVGVVGLVQEVLEVKLVSEQRARKNQLLASNDNDALTTEQLMCNLGGESADQVSSSVYDNLLFEHT
jgi:hypothetical protein